MYSTMLCFIVVYALLGIAIASPVWYFGGFVCAIRDDGSIACNHLHAQSTIPTGAFQQLTGGIYATCVGRVS